MSELREVFEMVTKQTEPDVDAWREQERRQRNANRNKKIGAIALVAVLVVAGVVLAISTMGSDDVQPAGEGANPTLGPKGTEQTLSIVDVRSGTGTTLTVTSSASEFDVTLDGSMVAYTDLDENGNAQVFVMDVDGSNARQLTSGEGGVSVADATGPFWSPDGSMIAYARDTSDNAELFVVRVSNGESTMVTQEPQDVVGPGGWAPDGGSIVFSTPNYSLNHYSALSVDLASGETRVIVPDGSSPTLSPDGVLIAFNSWLKPDPLVRLMIADADGSGRRVIARLEGEDGHQRWSPDSTQIAYAVRTSDGGFDTYVYDLATGGTRLAAAGRIESWVDDDHILVS
jgi:Tol biopolymer transport system component